MSAIPANSVVTGATLGYYVNDLNYGNTTLSLYQVTSSWNASTVTWSSQPAINSTADASQQISSAGNNMLDTPGLTGLVQQWVNDDNNYGMELRASPNVTTIASGKDASHYPILVVDYLPPPCPGLTPAQIRGGDGADSIQLNSVVGDGVGQTIAIIDYYNNPGLVSSTSPNFDSSDLHVFDQQFNLPDPPSFLKLDENGGTDYPSNARPVANRLTRPRKKRSTWSGACDCTGGKLSFCLKLRTRRRLGPITSKH